MKKSRKLISQLLMVCCAFCFAGTGAAETDQQYLPEGETTDISETNVSVSPRIIGGTESKDGEWPWMTALLYSSEADTYEAQFCSGVLISKSWVLTSAHCVLGETPATVETVVGAYDLGSASISRTKIKSIRIHPQYNSVSLQNDIALLELQQDSSLPPIPLFAGESHENVPPSLIGEMTTALGWGMADSPTYWYYPEKMRQVNLPVVHESQCNLIFPSTLLESQICAGYPAYSGKDVCNGDSGGPLIAEIDGIWLHVGLVSYGSLCKEYSGWYGVYSRTSSYISFIKQYVPDVRVHSYSPNDTTLKNRTLAPIYLLLLK